MAQAGTAAAVVSNFLWTFVVGQVFLTMLCSMRFGVFLFFAGMVRVQAGCGTPLPVLPAHWAPPSSGRALLPTHTTAQPTVPPASRPACLALAALHADCCPPSLSKQLQLAIMTLFALFFVPETKGLPVERIQVLFARHWFWRR